MYSALFFSPLNSNNGLPDIFVPRFVSRFPWVKQRIVYASNLPKPRPRPSLEPFDVGDETIAYLPYLPTNKPYLATDELAHCPTAPSPLRYRNEYILS